MVGERSISDDQAMISSNAKSRPELCRTTTGGSLPPQLAPEL